jgi:hypothetical protein
VLQQGVAVLQQGVAVLQQEVAVLQQGVAVLHEPLWGSSSHDTEGARWGHGLAAARAEAKTVHGAGRQRSCISSPHSSSSAPAAPTHLEFQSL